MSDIIKCDSCGRRVIGQTIGDTLKCPSCNATLEAGDSTIITSGITCPFCGETEKYWERDTSWLSKDKRKCPSCGEKVSEEEFEVLEEGGDATNERGGKEASISTKSAERRTRPIGDQVKASYESTKEHLNENPKLPIKIGLGVSCFCLTTFGGLMLDSAISGELMFYQAAMVSSAVMVHLFASLLFRDNGKT